MNDAQSAAHRLQPTQAACLPPLGVSIVCYSMHKNIPNARVLIFIFQTSPRHESVRG
jgi:hypothetical protein